MSFRISAREAVLKAAKDLSDKAGRIGVMRSVDATESSSWLKGIAQRLQATVALDGEPGGAEEGEVTLPDGLHRASILLKSWEISGGKNHDAMAEAFSEICAAHDALLASLRKKEVYAGVVRERDQQLKFIEQIKSLKDPETRYGIRISQESWLTIDGGPDLVGTKDQLEAVAKLWRAEMANDERVSYETVPYTGLDPADAATVEEFLGRVTSLTSG